MVWSLVELVRIGDSSSVDRQASSLLFLCLEEATGMSLAELSAQVGMVGEAAC